MDHTDLEKKTAIVEAAKKLLLHYGYEKTSMADIAKEAKIGKGTIYYYFETKEDIYVEILVGEMESVQKLVINAIDNEPDYGEKLRLVLTAPMNVFKSQAPFYLRFLMETTNIYRKKLVNLKKEKVCEFTDQITGLIMEGIAKGCYRDDFDPKELSSLIFRWFLFGDEDVDMNLSVELIERLQKDYMILAELMLHGIVKKEVG